MRLQVLKDGKTVEVTQVDNAFCPTGKGGGVDPTCGKGGKGRKGKGGGGSSGASKAKVMRFDRFADEFDGIMTSGYGEEFTKAHSRMIQSLVKDIPVDTRRKYLNRVYSDMSVEDVNMDELKFMSKLSNSEDISPQAKSIKFVERKSK